MKRIISFIMALAIIFTMSIPAFAANIDGQIIITNATINEDYTLYKIFDATISDKKDDKGNSSISYTMDTKVEARNENGEVIVDETTGEPVLVDNPLYVAMFTATGSTGANYFNFVPVEGKNIVSITRKTDVDVLKIQEYLNNLIDNNPADNDPNTTTAAEFAFVDKAKITTGDTLEFDNLEYGYYMIDKANATYVTLTSTTPSVNVVDKNQVPGGGFDKLVWDENVYNEETHEYGDWVENTTANVGDILKFEIDFEATNYNGEYPVKHYTVKDTKGSALWVEFNSIKVKLLTGLVNDPDTEVDESVIELNKGYYHYAATGVADKTNEWTLFGNGWTEAEKTEAAEKDADGNTQHARFANSADWYLIHRGYDAFDIVIPWMTNQNFTGTTHDFTLTYGEGATSKYPSPVTVVIEYTASVEPSATNINDQQDKLFNKADLSWAFNNTSDGPGGEQETHVKVYTLGIEKTDESTGAHLAGAIFELYSNERDENGNLVPVYVIPTNIKGVYIVDDVNTEVSGKKRESARKEYKEYLDEIGGYYKTVVENGETKEIPVQQNIVTTEVNGKIVITGLEAGKYYIKEIQAPDGYNVLTEAKLVEINETEKTFIIVADANGDVFDTENAVNGNSAHVYKGTIIVVPNNKGVELPSTGGEGAMKLITFGTITAIAFAALLITHKKMTIYED